MDNIAIRTRYPRHNVSARYRKRNVTETGGYKEKFARQMVLAVLILMFAGIIKSADTAVTNFLTEKVQGVLMQNIDLQSVYSTIGDMLNKANVKGDTGNDNGKLSDEQSDNSNEQGVKGVQDITKEANENDPLASASPIPSASPTPAAKSSAAASPSAAPSIFITPVSGVLGDGFGERVHPTTNKLAMHKGQDIEAVQGASIKAAAAGEVIEAGYEKTLGNYIKLIHSNNYNTIYAHCNELLVKKGQKVKQGDIIAKVGSTGLSTGSHLHFEIWKDGKVVNPLDYIKVPEK